MVTLLVPEGRRVDTSVELELSRLALKHGAFDCDALAMGGYALAFFDRHPESGMDYLLRALAINPVRCVRSTTSDGSCSKQGAPRRPGTGSTGRPEEAWDRFDRALDEFGFRTRTGRAFASLFGDCVGAVADARAAHAVAPGYTVCHRVLAAALAATGRVGEARNVVSELCRLRPGLRIAAYERETRFERPANREILFRGLRVGGLS